MTRAASIEGDATRDQRGEGGSIPTAALSFFIDQTDDATELVKRFHYSRRWPANVQIVGTFHEPGGLFGDKGRAVAACVFSVPPTRWSEQVIELTRLVRREGLRLALSRLIKWTLCELKRRAGWDLAVSFADRTQKHHGGVYQSAGWHYGGCRDRQMDGVLIGGKFTPGRTCNSVYGTRSPEKLSALLRCEVLPHFDEGKHLYWKPLSVAGRRKADRLGLESLDYPKPSRAS